MNSFISGIGHLLYIICSVIVFPLYVFFWVVMGTWITAKWIYKKRHYLSWRSLQQHLPSLRLPGFEINFKKLLHVITLHR